MSKAATAPELRQQLDEHLEVTREQTSRLDEILKARGEKGSSKKCKAMLGLIQEFEESMFEEMEPSIVDVALISSAQKIEHYEIAGYGSVCAFARLLGLEEDLQLLQKTLEEEKETDGKLTVLAENLVNLDAAQGESVEDQKDEVSEAEDRKDGRLLEEGEEEEAPKRGNRARGKEARPAAPEKRGNVQASRSAPSSKGSKGRSGSGSNASGSSSRSRSNGSSRATTDLEEIRRWAEARGGKPVTVKGTAKRGQGAGLLRIDFPGFSGKGTLEEVSWEEWYEKFTESNLNFLYQDKTKDGKESRFFKLVCNTDK